MPTYVVTAYCEKCAVNHPTAIELDCSEQISPEKNVAEVFEGMFVPPEIAMMSKNYFLCPQTGKMHKHEFARDTAHYKQVPFELSILGKEARLSGTIATTFSDFKIDPPSLLAIPVKNELPVRVEMTWRKEK